ncbi:hypothetical protein AAFF_G00095460 [Aldrovandia affinis]|uniref:Uncharacterized protein n=1 Tax=Aldrovandia affinis TaxID=143900 RepID=A0AAD7R1B9_9TELE|nr:hypothetical protein AAFF_G00095460 [Aldrovandia affinis]
MAMVKEPWSARQQRQLAFVSEFTTDIQHAAGKDNVVADCLFAVHSGRGQFRVDYGQMAADQASDPEVQALRAATTGLQLQERMPGPAVRVVGAADVLAIREDVIAATQRQRPTAGLCYYHASRQAWGGSFYRHYGSAVHARARRLDPQKLAVAKAEFDSMERFGDCLGEARFVFVRQDKHRSPLQPPYEDHFEL